MASSDFNDFSLRFLRRLEQRLKDLSHHAAGVSEGLSIAANEVGYSAADDQAPSSSPAPANRSQEPSGPPAPAATDEAAIHTRMVLESLRTSGPQTVNELRSSLRAKGLDLRPAQVRAAVSRLEHAGHVVKSGAIYAVATIPPDNSADGDDNAPPLG